MKKRALLVALAAARAASLAGCGGSSASSTTAAAGSAAEGSEAAGETAADASGKDSLVIVTSSDVLSMDPYRYDEGPTNQIMLHIYEAMVAQNADMSFGPCLAESWETSEDGLTWTFHLREGVKFHDGDVMDSGDVVASIKLASNPDSPSAYSSYTSSFESVEAPDANTVVIKTERPNPLMLFDVAQLYVLKQEIAEVGTEEQVADNVIGTGRYKFVEQVKEDHIDLAANEDYWGEVPAIKNVRFRPITNEATRTATMLTGDVDFTIDVSARDIDRLDATEGISVIKQKGLREIYLNLDSREDSPLFPGQKNPMSDVKVRQAMYLAIDEGTIIKNIMNGCAYEMNSVVPEDYVGYTEVTREAYDPEKAKELLAEAGWDGSHELVFSVPTGNSIREQAAVIIQQNLQEIGIKTKIESADFATHLTKVREGNYDLGLIGSGGSPDPSECVINFKPDHINNFSHLSDWTIYNTGAEGEHAFSFEDRKVNYDNYQELLVEQVPFCFLYFQNNLFAYNNRIGNVKDNQDYSQLNRDVWNWTIEK